MKSQKNILFAFVAMSTLILSTTTFGMEKSEAQEKQSESISFTQEEKSLLDDCTDTRDVRRWSTWIRFKEQNLFLDLAWRCGWSGFDKLESYNSQEHPDCAEILNFLKYYKQEQDRLSKELAILHFTKVTGRNKRKKFLRDKVTIKSEEIKAKIPELKKKIKKALQT